MKPRWRILILIIFLVALVFSLMGTINDISLDYQGINSETPLKIEYSFPNANCTKGIKKQFPYIYYHCTKKDDSSADDSLYPPELKPKEADHESKGEQ